METGAEGQRFVWFMLHSGYLRFFGSTVQELAERGNTVELAFTRLEKDAGDSRLALALAAGHPNITVAEAPMRGRRDGWRPMAGLVRALIDLGRYADPRYADAPALRARMARKLTDHVRTARAIDPLTRSLTLRLIRRVQSDTDAKLSRRLVSRLGAVERAIPTARVVDDFLRDRKPDAVLVSPVVEFASTQVEYVKSARRLAIPCAIPIASWDNLTGKGLIRVTPDRVLVWNEIQVAEATEMHGITAGRTIATGAPKFDEWFDRRPSMSREDFAAKVGLDPGRPFVLYACSSSFIARDEEAAFVVRWLEALRADPRLRDVGVLARPHPQNASQWRDVDLGDPHAVVWPRGGAQPDGGDARADFYDSLAYCAAVVGLNTSTMLEAAILGRSVLSPRTEEFAGTQEGTLHFRYLLAENGGFLHVGAMPGEHLDQLAAALEDDPERDEQTRRFVESFLRPRGLDRPTAPILADEVEAVGRLTVQRTSTAPGTALLRCVLAPLAFAGAFVGLAAEKIRGGPEPETEVA